LYKELSSELLGPTAAYDLRHSLQSDGYNVWWRYDVCGG